MITYQLSVAKNVPPSEDHLRLNLTVEGIQKFFVEPRKIEQVIPLTSARKRNPT